jgi:predicted nucleic acid-binding protein
MNLVDSSGWMEYFSNGSQAVLFKKPIEDTKRLIVPAICIYEVFKKTLQFTDEKKALEVTTVMRQGEVIPLDDHRALFAASLSHTFKLPMADSIILAVAQEYKALLWTQDGDFKNFPNVKYFEAKK